MRAFWLLLGSVALGLGLAIVWSPSFVDQTIGENGATTILGYSVTATPITGVLMAIGFAFVSGLTGTFTACNVAGLSAMAPLSTGRQLSIMSALRSLGWLALGTSLVAGLYGAIGALMGPSIPQLSQSLVGRFPIRLIQSMVVFGVLGLVLVAMGLAAMGHVRVDVPRPDGRYAAARLLLIGGLIGAFLIGRPLALFVKIFEYAAATHNPVLGALVLRAPEPGQYRLTRARFPRRRDRGPRAALALARRAARSTRSLQCRRPTYCRNLPHRLLVRAAAGRLWDRLVAKSSVVIGLSQPGGKAEHDFHPRHEFLRR